MKAVDGRKVIQGEEEGKTDVSISKQLCQSSETEEHQYRAQARESAISSAKLVWLSTVDQLNVLTGSNGWHITQDTACERQIDKDGHRLWSYELCIILLETT